MPTNQTEIDTRTAKAIAAIKSVYGTDGDEESVTLFVSHHIEEIEASYWEKHCGTALPPAESVLGILVLRSHWGDDDDGDEEGIDTFDFTLPDEVTDYVISVRFDEDGEVESVSMES
jgi:hypothetical protein